MRLAILGYGRMGRMVETAAEKRGWEVALVLDAADNSGGGGITPDAMDRVDVAVDFTVPAAVVENVRAAAACGVDMVVGTTGWYDRMDEVQEAVEGAGTGLVWAPNFSLGVQLFFRLVRAAGRLAEGLGGYDAYVSEIHHRHKVDHPSGTAERLAAILLEEISSKQRLAAGPGEGAVDPDVLQVVSVRAGENPGAHTVGLEGEHDRLELRHEARGREGFTAGALEAAEWILGREGVFTLDDMLDERIQRGRRDG